MVTLIKKLFIKDYENTSSPVVRLRYGTVAGVMGIISNFLLFLAKLAVALLSGSVAIMADAMNNLTDAGSSLVTIFGFKLSSRPADEEHPYGHARYEYVAGLIIAFIVVLIGFELGKSSVEKIISGEENEFSYVTVIVLVLAIAVKLWQGVAYAHFGKAISSETLMAAGADSRNDVISTTAVLLSSIFVMITGISVDAYVGLAVSLYILYSGIQLVRSTINPILGVAPDKELVTAIIDTVLSNPEILGIHDFVIHSYGASETFATAHAEVDAKSDLIACHDTIDNVEREVFEKFGVKLVIHMDPTIFDDEEANMLACDMVTLLTEQVHPKINIHEMRLVRGATHTNVLFDIVVPFDCKKSEAEIKAVVDAKLATYPTLYYAVLTFDRNYLS